MKNLYTIIFCLLLITYCFSCTHQEGVSVNWNTEDSEVAIDISSKQTRATVKEDPDTIIESIRVLVFDTIAGSEKCLYNYLFPKRVGKKTVRFKVAPETTYNLVLIANEHKDPLVEATLTAFNETKTLKDVYDIAFSADAFLDTEVIPMSVLYRNLKVLSNRRWVDRTEGKTDTVTYPIPIKIERLGVRLDITLKTKSADKQTEFQGIRLTNIPAQVPLFPFTYTYNASGDTIDNTRKADGSGDNQYISPNYHWIACAQGDDYDPDKPGEPWETVLNGDLDNDGVKEDYYVWKKVRTIIPSTVFGIHPPASTSFPCATCGKYEDCEHRGVDFILEYSDGSVTYKEGVLLGINTPYTSYSEHYPPLGTPPGVPYNYTLPRNTYLTLEAIMEDNKIIFNSVTVNQWGGRNDVGLGD